jgi:hypothetical protein
MPNPHKHTTQRTGVFIVRPIFSDSNPGTTAPENNSSTELCEEEMPHPQVEIIRILSLANRACLKKVSCLQMTDTGLFLN